MYNIENFSKNIYKRLVFLILVFSFSFFAQIKNISACSATPKNGSFLELEGEIDDFDCVLTLSQHAFEELYKIIVPFAMIGYVIAGYQYMIGQKEKGKKYIMNLTYALIFATLISVIINAVMEVFKIS